MENIIYFVLGMLVMVSIKSIFGYAYFSFYLWYRHGKRYLKAHAMWMDAQPRKF